MTIAGSLFVHFGKMSDMVARLLGARRFVNYFTQLPSKLPSSKSNSGLAGHGSGRDFEDLRHDRVRLQVSQPARQLI
jgi:hypothetical protein